MIFAASENFTMTPISVGASFEIAPISIREEIARKITNERLVEMQKERDELAGSELVLLSTYNRVGLYCYCRNPNKAAAVLSKILTDAPLSEEFQPFCLIGEDALAHLFSVAAGLDSLVLGEVQIISQIKEALVKARDYSLSGPMLSNLLRKAIVVGIEARRFGPEYSSESRSSISYSITKFLSKYIDENRWQELEKNHHSKPDVLILGSGKMATLAMETLDRTVVCRVIVASRKPLKRKFGIYERIDIFDIDRKIGNIDFDIIISAVSSERLILLPQHFSFLSDANHIHKSILIIDM